MHVLICSTPLFNAKIANRYNRRNDNVEVDLISRAARPLFLELTFSKSVRNICPL